jgi:hypothetical protein
MSVGDFCGGLATVTKGSFNYQEKGGKWKQNLMTWTRSIVSIIEDSRLIQQSNLRIQLSPKQSTHRPTSIKRVENKHEDFNYLDAATGILKSVGVLARCWNGFFPENFSWSTITRFYVILHFDWHQIGDRKKEKKTKKWPVALSTRMQFIKFCIFIGQVEIFFAKTETNSAKNCLIAKKKSSLFTWEDEKLDQMNIGHYSI